MPLLTRSCSVVNQQLPLFLLIAVLGISVVVVDHAGYWVAAGIANWLLGVVLMGRISATVRGVPGLAAGEILSRYWLKVLLASLLVSMPFVILILIATSLGDISTNQTLNWAVSPVLAVVTVYVLPIVYLRNEVIISVVAGIVFLFQNFQRSQAVVGALIAGYSIAYLLFRLGGGSEDAQPVNLAFIVLIQSYVEFVTFAAATMILIGSDFLTEPER